MMLKKMCIIVNWNLYESKRYFTEKFTEALHRKGIKTLVIDVQEQSLGKDNVKKIHSFAPDLTCSFNSLEPLEGRTFLWDLMKIPHLSILVDPALYSVQLISSPYSIISCVDRQDCDALRSNNFQNTFFLPHAVEKELAASEKANRIYDVVFLGTCIDYKNMKKNWKQRYPEAINKALDKAVNCVLADNHTSLTEALVSTWEKNDLNTVNTDFLSLFHYIDYYSRGKDRVELIRGIKDAHVHVFGDLDPNGIHGWTTYLASMPNVTVHPPVTFEEGLSILKQSKITLNSMPFFKSGSHERIFTGLACGAVPITTDNLYVRENFNDFEDLILYKPKQVNLINAQVNNLLANEGKRQEIASNGRAKVMKFHTWDNRVDELNSVLPLILQKIQE
jgi:spore maturation protein CgeB